MRSCRASSKARRQARAGRARRCSPQRAAQAAPRTLNQPRSPTMTLMAEPPEAETAPWAIDVANVTKRFGATVALNNASFRVRRGAVHALLGENGAGKSTTVKLLSGLMQPHAGSISIMGRNVSMRGPKDAHRAGVQTAFQEMTLVRDLTVAQNLLMAYEPTGWF